MRAGTKFVPGLLMIALAANVSGCDLFGKKSSSNSRPPIEEPNNRGDIELSLQKMYDGLTADLILAENSSPQEVATNLYLPTTLENGVSVEWQSNRDSIIKANGEVTVQPTSVGKQEVKLSAILKKGSVTKTKVFQFTVIEDQAAYDSLLPTYEGFQEAMILASNSERTAIVADLSLPTSLEDGTKVSWHSSSADVLSPEGIVTRPTDTEGNADVTLTATFRKGQAELTKVFQVTVMSEAFESNQAAYEAFAEFNDQDLLGDNLSRQEIISDLTLPETYKGVSVNWTSDQPTIIDSTGRVQRPVFESGDILVKITAEFLGSSVSYKISFPLKVIKQPESPANRMAEVGRTLKNGSVILGENNSLFEVKSNLKFLRELDEVSITWSSSDPSVIDETGRVTRSSESDKEVSLTATLSIGSESSEVTIIAKVLEKPDTAADAVAEAMVEVDFARIAGDNTSESNIKSDLDLINAASNGVAISWKSSAAAVVSNAGLVSRPTPETGDQAINLTATFTQGQVSVDKVFELVVKAKVDVEAAIASTLRDLSQETLLGNNTSPDEVRTNLDLPSTVGEFGLTWASSNEAVIDPTGVVARPVVGEEDKIVTLTAKLSFEDFDKTKEFKFKVLAEVDARQEVLEEALQIMTEKWLLNTASYYTRGGLRQNLSLNFMTQSLNLPVTIADGRVILTWKSTGPAYQDLSHLYNAGDDMVHFGVRRPAYTDGPSRVDLVATLEYDSLVEEKVFQATVVPEVATYRESIDLGLSQLTLISLLGENDSASDVTENLKLNESLAHGVKVKWRSSNEAVMSSRGVYRRPEAATQVTLTATLMRGPYSVTKSFKVTVK